MIGQALTFCWINATERFGNELDLEMRIQAFKFVLADRFTIDEILSAFKKFMIKSPKMIAPADVYAILSPEPAKVSHAEFIHAKEQWKLEGYPSYSSYAMTVRQYEKEQCEVRNPEPKNKIPIDQLVHDVKKRIELQPERKNHEI